MTDNTHTYIDADVLYAWLTSLEETVKKDYEERGLDHLKGKARAYHIAANHVKLMKKAAEREAQRTA